MLKRIRTVLEKRKIKSKKGNNFYGDLIESKNKKKESFSSTYITQKSRDLFTQNPKLLNSLSRIGSQLNIFNPKLPNSFKIGNLIFKKESSNLIKSLSNRVSEIDYTFKAGKKEYTALIKGVENKEQEIANFKLKESLLKNSELKKLGINVLEPIFEKGINFNKELGRRNTNRRLILYEENIYKDFKSLSEMKLSKSKINSINSALKEINNEFHNKGILPKSISISLDHLYYSLKNKKYYII